jgi:hypothetical protein
MNLLFSKIVHEAKLSTKEQTRQLPFNQVKLPFNQAKLPFNQVKLPFSS